MAAVGADSGPGEQQILNLTARLWQGPPRSFLGAQRFQSEKRMGHHHQSYVVMPTPPTPSLVVIQPELLLQLVVAELDLPATLR